MVNYSEEVAIVKDVKGGWRHVKTIKLFYNFIVKEGEGFPGTNTDIEEEICTIFIIIYNMCWNFCHLLVKFKTARFHLLAWITISAFVVLVSSPCRLCSSLDS